MPSDLSFHIHLLVFSWGGSYVIKQDFKQTNEQSKQRETESSLKITTLLRVRNTQKQNRKQSGQPSSGWPQCKNSNRTWLYKISFYTCHTVVMLSCSLLDYYARNFEKVEGAYYFYFILSFIFPFITLYLVHKISQKVFIIFYLVYKISQKVFIILYLVYKISQKVFVILYLVYKISVQENIFELKLWSLADFLGLRCWSPV